jgi:hypothetical protein
LKNGLETVLGIRYKLRMMGVPIDSPTYTYVDNMSVVHNGQRPESTLNKKSNSICYHFARECVAADEAKIGHVPTNKNPADLATKIIGGGQKRAGLVGILLHDIHDNDT